jgi:hypothetical protein
LWELTDGSYGWFRNQVSEVEQMRIKVFNQELARAQIKHGDYAQKFVWSNEYYGDYFRRSRDLYTNNPNESHSYALLDGAPFARIEPLLQHKKVPTGSLRWLAIATDGCFPVEWSRNMKLLYKEIQQVANEKTSLEDFYTMMRQAALDSSTNHTKKPELTFTLTRADE